jgi:dTDP-4-dehydrorhamnose reductase
MPKPRVLVTGGTGLVGGTILLSNRLYDLFEVHATYREIRLQTPCLVNWFQLDLVDQFNDIHDTVSNLSPDVIIHCAAESHVDRCADNLESCSFMNQHVSKELARIAEELGSHFIHLSSDFVFSGEDAPYSENDHRDPVNDYGKTKIQAEDSILNVCPSATIIRTVLVYGFIPTLSRGNLLTWVVNSLKQGKPIKVVNDQYRKPTSVNELADALITIAERRLKGIFHLCGGEFVSVYDMAIIIAKTYDLDSSLISPISSLELNEKNARPKNTALELDKARYILGYHPKPIAQSLLEYQAYFQA